MTSRVPTTPQPWAYWNNLRRTQGRLYYQPRVQKLVLESRKSMSEEQFYEADDSYEGDR